MSGLFFVCRIPPPPGSISSHGFHIQVHCWRFYWHCNPWLRGCHGSDKCVWAVASSCLHSWRMIVFDLNIHLVCMFFRGIQPAIRFPFRKQNQQLPATDGGIRELCIQPCIKGGKCLASWARPEFHLKGFSNHEFTFSRFACNVPAVSMAGSCRHGSCYIFGCDDRNASGRFADNHCWLA